MKLPAICALCFVCFASSVVISDDAKKPKDESFLVEKILEVGHAKQAINPPNLIVTATGEVSTPGHKATLVRVIYVTPPADGYQEYELKATKPTGIVTQVISQVSASDTWVNFQAEAPWLRGVRVKGVGKGIKEKAL